MPLPIKTVHENLYEPISYNQFNRLSSEFLKATQKRFNTNDLNINIILYNKYRYKLTPFDKLTVEALKSFAKVKKEYDDKAIIKTLNNIKDVTKEDFKQAASICISVKPKEAIENYPNAWGLATFKDNSPNITTFYIQ